MDFYVIPPLSNLELMNEGKGNRYFCLAQLYKQHSHYREFFQQKSRDGAWITLDNGAGDHNIVTFGDLLDITDELRPNEVIPPDILFKLHETVVNCWDFYCAMQARNIKEIEILACPQGADIAQWTACYNVFLDMPFVNTIGFSKITIPKIFLGAEGDMSIMDARILAYRTVKANDQLKKPIHMLGMGNPNEMQEYKHDSMIRSMDSCNSVWAAMNYVYFWEYNFKRITTPKNYFDLLMTEEQVKHAVKNTEWMKQLISE